MDLQQFFKENRRVALALSGGTDSALLLRLAHDAGAEVRPYFIKTAFQPDFELEDAALLAAEVGVDLEIIELDILACPEAAANGPRRCYFCKKALFTALKERAAADGFTTIIDGTNASDDADDRPGMQALAELGILSPLRLCGVGKDEVRRLSKELGLFTANKPSYACLATRIPTGEEITEEKLEIAEEAEGMLYSLGFSDLRVRLDGDTARVQLPLEQLLMGHLMKDTIRMALSPWFEEIVLEQR